MRISAANSYNPSMLYNLHTHSFYCGHGSGRISEYASRAEEKGFSFLGFSEHCPFPDGLFADTRMAYGEMAAYEGDVRAEERPFPVLLGYEIDYMKGLHQYFAEVRERTDYLIAGVHFVRRPDGGWATPFSQGFDDGDIIAYIDRAVEAMESGLITFFAHPDVFLCRRPYDRLAADAAREISRASKALSIPLEINGNGILKGKGGYPHPAFWEEVRKNTDVAVLSTDAHHPEHLDKTIGEIRRFAEDLDFTVLEPALDDGRLVLRREQGS